MKSLATGLFAFVGVLALVILGALSPFRQRDQVNHDDWRGRW